MRDLEGTAALKAAARVIPFGVRAAAPGGLHIRFRYHTSQNICIRYIVYCIYYLTCVLYTIYYIVSYAPLGPASLCSCGLEGTCDVKVVGSTFACSFEGPARWKRP